MVGQNPRVWIVQENSIVTSVIYFLGCICNTQEKVQRKASIGIRDTCQFIARVTEMIYEIVIQAPVLKSRSRDIFNKPLDEFDVFNLGQNGWYII